MFFFFVSFSFFFGGGGGSKRILRMCRCLLRILNNNYYYITWQRNSQVEGVDNIILTNSILDSGASSDLSVAYKIKHRYNSEHRHSNQQNSKADKFFEH